MSGCPTTSSSGVARLRGPHYRRFCIAITLLLGACGKPAEPGTMTVQTARLIAQETGTTLTVEIPTHLGEAHVAALRSGVVLPLIWVFEWRRPRTWLWDSLVWRGSGTRQISYRPLTRHFAIDDRPTGGQSSYPDATEMTRALARLSVSLPNLPPSLVNGAYRLRFRMRLDVGELPPSLRLPSYLSTQWHLDSGWHEWPQNAALAMTNSG